MHNKNAAGAAHEANIGDLKNQCRKGYIPQPIQCGFCNDLYQSIEAYNLHVEPTTNGGSFHQHPSRIPELHFTGTAWEIK